MKKIVKSKKADDVAYEEVIFIVINVAFFCLMLLFAYRVGSSDSIKEENYAKSLSLIIDSMKPGTEIIVNIGKLIDTAENNKVKENVFYANLTSGKITITLMPGGGYSFVTFTKLSEVAVDNIHKTLIVKT